MAYNFGNNVSSANRAFGASSFGNVFANTTSAFGSPFSLLPPESEPGRRMLTLVAIVGLVILVLVLIAYVINYAYPFIAEGALSFLPLASATRSQRYWTNLIVPANADPPSQLLITKDESIAKRSNVYTFMIDLFIANSKSSSMGSYRHILHRGSDSYNQTNPETALAQQALDASSSPSAEASLASAARSGGVPLPNYMNPGVFMHPYRNDIVFFFQSEAAASDVVGSDILYIESLALDDVPVQEWFRVTVSLNDNVVDIYKNGDLVKSMILKGKPRSVENQWYGRSGPVPFSGVLMNMKMWDGNIPASLIKSSASIAFPPKPELTNLTEECPVPLPPQPEQKA
jgi:hypothetical protein